MNPESSPSRGLRLVSLAGLLLTSVFAGSAPGADPLPTLLTKSTVVKPGENIVGTGIAYGSSSVYFSAQWNPGSNDEAVIGAFSAPMPNDAPPAWSRSWPGVGGFDAFLGVDVAADGVYFAGSSYSQTTDTVGGKERKEIVAKFNLDGVPGGDTAGAVWVGRQRFYPASNTYDGDEYFGAARVSIEGGTTYFYGAGHAQPNGCSNTYAIRKYAATGAAIWQWQQPTGVCGGSDFGAIVVDGSTVYASGYSGLAGNLPQILLFSAPSGSGGPSATWSGTLDAGYTLGVYTSMAVSGGRIYAAGYLSSGERQAYLLDVWSGGTRLFHRVWSSDAAQSNGQQLMGIVAVGSRLFAVGYTRNTDNPAVVHNMGGASVPVLPNAPTYHGYGDGVIFEVSPADGSLISTTSYGTNDATDQAFTGVTTDGDDLYVVGAERDTTSGPYRTIVIRYATTQADLAITKTDGHATYGVPGSPITYTIVASNAGPGSATGATVVDTVPAAITGATWTCFGVNGAGCAASGSGSIDDTVNLPAGGTVIYTLAGTIGASANGSLSNTATVSAPSRPDPNLANNSATDTDAAPPADLSITKTDGLANYGPPGTPITYTIVASNAGPSPVTGATVADVVPADIAGATWTCVGAGGGTCAASGSGSINDTASLPVGGTVTYTLAGTIGGAATGSLSNTATVTAPGWVTDPDPTNNSATDTDTPPEVDLSITKTDGQDSAVPGSPVTYTIVASNAGPGSAAGATVVDTVPAAITGATWTCVGAGGGTCAASGSGDINDTVDLPVGGTVTYTLAGTVSPALIGTLSNTATVAAPAGVTEVDPANDSATDTDISPSLDYFTLAPCRVVDTRGGAPIGGPVMQGQETREFTVVGHCEIPQTAKAISINVTVTQPSAMGNVRLFPAGQTVPSASTINYTAGQTRANNAIVVLDPTGAMAAFIGQAAGTTVHLIIDVNGYFE